MVNYGIGTTDEEARTNGALANTIVDALVGAVKKGGGPLRGVTFCAPGSGAHQTWTKWGASECPDCLRARIRFRSPAEPGLVAHFCPTCWELVLERGGSRVACASRRLAKVLHDFPPGWAVLNVTVEGRTIPFNPPLLTPIGKPS